MKYKLLPSLFIGIGVLSLTVNTSFAEEIGKSLSIGHRGDDVVILQDFLTSKGYLEGASTGYFGKKTMNAIMRYQKDNNLASVGRVGPLTRKMINEELKASRGDDGHTAQNSLDVNGTYTGVLPCASCEGIETSLTLSGDTFSLTEKYIKGEGFVATSTGSFTWKDGRVIVLKDTKNASRLLMYKVQENKLVQLDVEGKVITGKLESFYVLSKAVKSASPVENKTWKLVELQGKKISGTSDTHYMALDAKEGRLSAKAGCNQIGGGYTLNGLSFKVREVFSTMMACENMGDEQALSQVLEMVDNISYTDTTLSLNKARMAPLARFELVK
jgi:copper homeostasis protein (lipoprotein)